MLMIEFHMVEDSIHLDIDSRNYYCVTVWHSFLELEEEYFMCLVYLGAVGIISIGTGNRPFYTYT